MEIKLEPWERVKYDEVPVTPLEKRLLQRVLGGENAEKMGPVDFNVIRRLEKRLADHEFMHTFDESTWHLRAKEAMNENLAGHRIGKHEFGAGDICQALNRPLFKSYVEAEKQAMRDEGMNSYLVELWQEWFPRHVLDYLANKPF